MTERILASAKRTPSIKRVVLTSSSGAGVVAKPGVEVFIDETSWNEESKTLARTVEVNDPMKPVWVYYASKAEGEQAAWRFVKEEKVRRVLACSQSQRSLIFHTATAPL